LKGYYTLRKTIFEILNKKLSKDLYYHGVHHTLDALRVCTLYLRHVKLDKHQARLLRLGILFHDIGFTVSVIDHEQKGTEIARELMVRFGYTTQDIDTVVRLILSTEVPQQPKTLLEKVICDIDLDYLGRSDFYKISNDLFKELQITSGLKDKNEWNKIQVKFLESHRFHTEFAIKNRQPEKEKRIEEIKLLIHS